MTFDLDKAYKEAYDKISNIREKLPPDVMLRLYAYHKQAEKGDNFSFNSQGNIKNAFKFNAWVQLKGMNAEEAKVEYINLVNTILK